MTSANANPEKLGFFIATVLSVLIQFSCFAERISPSDLQYLGAFRMPPGNGYEELSWCYSGGAMAYCNNGDPQGDGDGHPGSIFATGHEQFQFVAEISIPKPMISKTKNVSELPRAKFLQPLTDIREAAYREYELPRAGLAWVEKPLGQNSDMLYYTWAQHLDETANRLSHGAVGSNLGKGKRFGPWKIKDKDDYLTADYLFPIPKPWAEKYVSGMPLATGRYRDGGQASQGPTIFAFKPFSEGKFSEPGTELQAVTLLQYPSIIDDPEGKQALRGYTHADAWNGAAWMQNPAGKEAVVITGIKGHGKCWYGYGDGTVWPDEPPYPPEPEGGRGWWAEKFVPTILFYDPAELASVAKGEIKAHQPQPYARLDISQYLFHIPENEIWMMLGAAACDPQRGILYLFEFNADRENWEPIIHAWQIR